jgi:hypothetical protein
MNEENDAEGIGALQAAALLDYAYAVPFEPSHLLPSLIFHSNKGAADETRKDIQRVWVYPNPASDEFTVRYLLPENTQAVTLSLLDVNGKVLYESRLAGAKGIENIDASSLAEGIYFYRIDVPGLDTYTGKLIIQR